MENSVNIPTLSPLFKLYFIVNWIAESRSCCLLRKLSKEIKDAYEKPGFPGFSYQSMISIVFSV